MRKSKICKPLSTMDIITLFIEELVKGIIQAEILQIPWFFRILYLTHHFA